MSQRTRGQEISLRIAVDGQLQEGSFFKVVDFTTTHRSEIPETEFLGEDASDIDFRHDGFDFSWTLHEWDEAPLDLIATIIDREKQQQAHPEVTITVIHSYRGTGAPSPRVEVYHECVIRASEQGFSGRTEYNTIGFEAKAREKSLLTA